MISYRRSESGFRMTKGYDAYAWLSLLRLLIRAILHEACSPYTG